MPGMDANDVRWHGSYAPKIRVLAFPDCKVKGKIADQNRGLVAFEKTLHEDVGSLPKNIGITIRYRGICTYSDSSELLARFSPAAGSISLGCISFPV
jgi:hypothetical protein